MRASRIRTLPAHGVAIVGTDVHGNAEDFERLVVHFEAEADAHLVVLGDIVHAPNEAIRSIEPDLYDFDDGSAHIARRIVELERARPGRVHFVLGNHDWAHVGGPRTAKFYPDEAAHLEATMDEASRAVLHDLFARALLCVRTPCGAALTHASPSSTVRDLKELEDVGIPCQSPRDRQLVAAFVTAYGHERSEVLAFLANVSRDGVEQRLVVHGHDRTEDGFYVEGEIQVCPCIFGAPRGAKRYVRLELGARYENVRGLRDGEEIRRLWPD